jgi:hypothetical protein
MLNGVFTFAVYYIRALLGLLGAMLAYFHQGLNNVFKRIVVVVMDNKAVLVRNAFAKVNFGL